MPRGIQRFKAPETLTIIELDTRTKSALTANVDDYDLSVGACFNVGGTGGIWAITGIAGGTAGRVISLINYLSLSIILPNESGSSLAQNRILTPSGLQYLLTPNQQIFLSYSNEVNRWIISSLPGDPSMNILRAMSFI